MFRIYRNLHKKSFSIQQKVDGRWKVVAVMDNFIAEGVEFKVYETGRQRVIKTGQKNVHAFILTNRISNFQECPTIGDRIWYNPYVYTNFVQNGVNAPCGVDLVFKNDGVFVLN